MSVREIARESRCIVYQPQYCTRTMKEAKIETAKEDVTMVKRELSKEKLKLKQGGDRGEEVGGRETIVAMEEILVMKETVSVVETVLVPL